MKQLIAIIILLLVSKVFFAQTIYSVDSKESKIEWKGFKPGGEHKGTINIITGTLVLPNDESVSGSFIIDMQSIYITDMTDKEDIILLTKELTQEDFFNSRNYSISLFEIKKTEKINNENHNYQITGNLTIKEITKEITFPANIIINKDKLQAKAKIGIDRQNWDLKMNNFIKELALSNDIELNVNILATKKSK